jgi:glutamyl-tRNA synthetase
VAELLVLRDLDPAARTPHPTTVGDGAPIAASIRNTVGVAGRFAPSPTGDLHLGNLRTAAIAWLSARSRGEDFVVRMEDLDRHQANVRIEQSQLDDLAAVGIDWDGDVVRQSERFARYDAAIDDLAARGLVYECYCTRREIRDEIEAASAAPHGPPGSYPGTCRELTAIERSDRRREGRRPALRLRTDGRKVDVDDVVHGRFSGPVDDVVLRRNDGVPAYNLAVVVDDAAQGVTEVVRGDDLLSSTPRQIHLQRLLGYPQPTYLHVPLVVDANGDRLAKRRGEPITMADLAARAGIGPAEIVTWIATSLGLAARPPVTLRDLVDRFDPTDLASDPCPAPPFAAS